MKGAVVTTTTWLDLRDAALGATRRGWPVTPGTYLGTDRRWHGRDNAQTLCPNDTWADAPVTDPARPNLGHVDPGALRGRGNVPVATPSDHPGDPETTVPMGAWGTNADDD